MVVEQKRRGLLGENRVSVVIELMCTEYSELRSGLELELGDH